MRTLSFLVPATVVFSFLFVATGCERGALDLPMDDMGKAESTDAGGAADLGTAQADLFATLDLVRLADVGLTPDLTTATDLGFHADLGQASADLDHAPDLVESTDLERDLGPIIVIMPALDLARSSDLDETPIDLDQTIADLAPLPEPDLVIAVAYDLAPAYDQTPMPDVAKMPDLATTPDLQTTDLMSPPDLTQSCKSLAIVEAPTTDISQTDTGVISSALVGDNIGLAWIDRNNGGAWGGIDCPKVRIFNGLVPTGDAACPQSTTPSGGVFIAAGNASFLVSSTRVPLIRFDTQGQELNRNTTNDLFTALTSPNGTEYYLDLAYPGGANVVTVGTINPDTTFNPGMAYTVPGPRRVNFDPQSWVAFDQTVFFTATWLDDAQHVSYLSLFTIDTANNTMSETVLGPGVPLTNCCFAEPAMSKLLRVGTNELLVAWWNDIGGATHLTRFDLAGNQISTVDVPLTLIDIEAFGSNRWIGVVDQYSTNNLDLAVFLDDATIVSTTTIATDVSLTPMNAPKLHTSPTTTYVVWNGRQPFVEHVAQILCQ